MSYRFFIIIALFVVPVVTVPVDTIQSTAKSVNANIQNNEMNFDELEDLAKETNAFEKAEFAKPSRLMILLQIVGMPLFNAYLKLTDTMTSVSTWFNQKFKNNRSKVHEAR